MALFTLDNLVWLTYAHFLIFFVPAMGLGISMLREARNRQGLDRKDDVIHHVTFTPTGKRAA